MEQLTIRKLIRIIASLIFMIYFTFLLYRLFFFAYGQYFRYFENQIRINFIPFKTISNYVVGINKYKLNIWFYNLFGNVLAFMPMGFLIPLILTQLKNLKRITFVTLTISIIFEVIQFWLKLGVADIDDVILNTVGGSIGYLVLELSQKIIGQRINYRRYT